MKVIWHPRAEAAMFQVADYIRERFGTKRKKTFMQEVRQTTKMLRRSPNIGSLDPLFDDRSIAYRSIIINGLSKMVYFIDNDNDTIYIAAFWDTRREPKKQAEQAQDIK